MVHVLCLRIYGRIPLEVAMSEIISGDHAAHSRPARHSAAEWLELVGIAVVSTIFLLALMLWLDNVHISTTNGLWKSVPMEQWKVAPEMAPLDPSNYLYFPLI